MASLDELLAPLGPLTTQCPERAIQTVTLQRQMPTRDNRKRIRRQEQDRQESHVHRRQSSPDSVGGQEEQ